MPIVLPSGETLKISKDPLGVGGEGKVYRVANEGQKGIIAKIYKRLPDRERQEKLKAMISICNPVLMDACAWPIATLVDTRSGEICGFTMNEVVESEPLHHFYSPSWRKQNQPNASWDNLLQLSANLTAVFSVVHDMGIVVGDVNPNSLRVRKNGRVVLIDSDSFQLSHNGSLFKCRVGVPSFTPPELLSSNQTFDLIKRSINHDLFGLSLLIFHVLFMGRHPFAGVFNGPGDTPIESHIREFRYAYAVDHKQRGLLPPPLSISPRLVASLEVAEVFENDFTQIGAVKGRTSSKRWFEVISKQRQRLARCKSNSNHVYDCSVGTCIWCALERKGLSFFESRMPVTSSNNTSESSTRFKPADLLPTKTEEAAWRRISAVSVEKNVIPAIRLSTIQPRYGLTETERVFILRRSRLRLLTCLIAVMILLMGQTTLMPLIAILLIVGFSYSPKSIRELIARYKAELAQVEADITGLKTSWNSLTDGSKQTHIISTAQTAWSTIQSLKDQFDNEIAYKLNVLRQQHKDSYLRSWLIADAGIPGIGPGRSSTLTSYGIESAADISAERLYGISGFGPVLTSSLLAWKTSLISGYHPPSDDRLLKGEEKGLLSRYMKIRRQASADLQFSIEAFDENAKEAKRLRADLEIRTLKLQQLAASIRADISQLRQPALSISKGKYWYLIF
jgi:DNA-binding helix-hairpin-helix protein with protein kinase domain